MVFRRKGQKPNEFNSISHEVFKQLSHCFFLPSPYSFLIRLISQILIICHAVFLWISFQISTSYFNCGEVKKTPHHNISFRRPKCSFQKSLTSLKMYFIRKKNIIFNLSFSNILLKN